MFCGFGYRYNRWDAVYGGRARVYEACTPKFLHELSEGHGSTSIDLVVGERNFIRFSDCLVCLWEVGRVVSGVEERVEKNWKVVRQCG